MDYDDIDYSNLFFNKSYPKYIDGEIPNKPITITIRGKGIVNILIIHTLLRRIFIHKKLSKKEWDNYLFRSNSLIIEYNNLITSNDIDYNKLRELLNQYLIIVNKYFVINVSYVNDKCNSVEKSIKLNSYKLVAKIKLLNLQKYLDQANRIDEELFSMFLKYRNVLTRKSNLLVDLRMLYILKVINIASFDPITNIGFDYSKLKIPKSNLSKMIHQTIFNLVSDKNKWIKVII